MNRAKKILCLLLSCVMLLTCFAFSGTALEEGKSIGVILKPDKEVANPGDTITYTMYIDLPSDANLILIQVALSYNSEVFEAPPTSMPKVYLNDFAGYFLENNATASAAVHKSIQANLAKTGEDKLFDSSISFLLKCDANKGTTAKGFSITSAETPQMTFTMKVREDAPAGAEGRVGLTKAAMMTTTRYKIATANGGAGNPIAADMVDYTQAVGKLTVAGGEQPATPVLNKDGRQVKMSVQSGAVVKGTEQLRVISSISKADWDANFAQTATADTTKNAIQKVGIVANNGTVPFDMTTAQNVAKGTPAEGYSVEETTYIQQAADNTYKFGARIEYKTDVYDTTYVAFVEYTDAQGVTQYMFYDAEASVAFKTNYKTITDQYIAKFPG